MLSEFFGIKALLKSYGDDDVRAIGLELKMELENRKCIRYELENTEIVDFFHSLDRVCI